MNIVSNSLLKNILKALKLFLVIFIINSSLYLYLPKIGVEKEISKQFDTSFYNLRLKEVFTKEKVQKKTQVKQEELKRIDSFILLAIYSFEDLNGWIVISSKTNQRKSSIIDKGENFQGYKLIEVHPKKAVFEKNNNFYEVFIQESLNLKKQLKAIEQGPTQKDSFKVSKKYIKQYITNFDSIWKSIAIKEVLDSKKQIQGFKVLSIKKGSAFDKLGLRAGDVIKKVNNIELKSYESAFKFYNNINKYDSLQITVNRRGNTMEIDYEIE